MYPSTRPPSQAGGRQRPGRGQGQGGASSAPSAPPFLELGPAPELDFGQGPGYQGRVVMGTTAFTAIAGSIKQVSSGGARRSHKHGEGPNLLHECFHI